MNNEQGIMSRNLCMSKIKFDNDESENFSQNGVRFFWLLITFVSYFFWARVNEGLSRKRPLAYSGLSEPSLFFVGRGALQW